MIEILTRVVVESAIWTTGIMVAVLVSWAAWAFAIAVVEAIADVVRGKDKE